MAIGNAKLCRGQDERLLNFVVADAVECETAVVHPRIYFLSRCHSIRNLVPYLDLISGDISSCIFLFLQLFKESL